MCSNLDQSPSEFSGGGGAHSDQAVLSGADSVELLLGAAIGAMVMSIFP